MSKVLNTVLAALVISSAASLAIPSITLAASNSGGQSSGPSGGGNDGGGGDGGNGDGKEPLRLIGPGPGVQRAQIPPNYPPRDPEPK